MLTLPPAVKIHLCTTPTDMRKGHDGLCALVQYHLGEDAFSGHLYVFVSRRGNRIEILFWDSGGFVLWYKRLEKNRFKVPRLPAGQASVRLEAAQLALLLEGFDYSKLQPPRRWTPPAHEPFSQPAAPTAPAC